MELGKCTVIRSAEPWTEHMTGNILRAQLTPSWDSQQYRLHFQLILYIPRAMSIAVLYPRLSVAPGTQCLSDNPHPHAQGDSCLQTP